MVGRHLLAIAALAALAAVLGCGSPAAEFRRYETYARKVEVDTGEDGYRLRGPQLAEVDELLTALFGTPDDPALPQLEGTDVAQVVDLAKVGFAAGPVGSDQLGNARGLYREHCAHCHGITGDGNGPTAAFLNPYPRDYRPGKFKFKSTPVGVRPTHGDLKKVLLDGIAGTAMPSFKLLSDLEVESLVHYVKYLSIRGETERNLLYLAANGETASDPNPRLVPSVNDGATAEQKQAQKAQLDAIKDQLAGVVQKWVDGEAASVEIPPRKAMTPDELIQSQKLGRDLFYGTIANCVKCHGESSLGDGQVTDYDDWTKEFIGDGKNPVLTREFVALGLPQPRNIRPRNLRMGVYRGGMRPIDIYWRIKNGIEGVPMPAATMKPEGDASAKGLTPDDIWHIVNYVQSLPYESISDPNDAERRALGRERM